MELFFNIIKYLVLGFFGLIALLILLAVLFGKRIKKKWEYEAEFHDESGREFGEFDIEMSRIEKEEPDHTFKAKFRMRHPSLQVHQTIQVYLDDVLILEGMVKKSGRILLGKKHLRNSVEDAQIGQKCRVVIGGQEQFVAEMQPD